MNFLIHPRTQAAFKVIVSASLILFLVNLVNTQDLSVINPDISGYLAGGCLVLIAALGCMAFRWKLLIGMFSPASFGDLFRLYFIGSFFNIFLPGAIGGDVVRATSSNRKYGLGIKRASLIVLLERASGLVALAITFSLGLILYAHDNIFPYAQIAPVIVLATVAVLVVAFKYWINRSMEVGYRYIVAIVLFSFLGQYADILIAYFFSQYFGLGLNLYQFMIMVPIVFIATIVPISVGGTGVREGAMAALLAVFGVPAATAVLISLLMYVVKIIVGLIGFPLYLADSSIRNTERA